MKYTFTKYKQSKTKSKKFTFFIKRFINRKLFNHKLSKYLKLNQFGTI